MASYQLKNQTPGVPPSQEYYDCRYAVLREPIGFPRGAEILSDDDQAIHAWIEQEGLVIAVGRAHLIPPTSDGTGSDHAGAGASKCPGFGPLKQSNYRPAIQIRQMGTRAEHQRNGYAAKVLESLENQSASFFDANYGFLQARANAVPFYLSQGWEVIDEPYDIKGIGPHLSMMKRLKT